MLNQRFVVVIDPGHGGHNHGCDAAADGIEEKEVTLAMAGELAESLRARIDGATILLTREDDVWMSLADRVAFANEMQADVFISLHANASESKTQHGFETYVLDARASSLDAARTARRENDAELAAPTSKAANPEVEMMVRQLELAAHRQDAVRLATAIQAEQAARFPLRRNRGVRQAPFDVLMGARMPAVLFEAGFLDHPEESALLLDASARAPVVDGLVDAFVAYYRARRRG